MAEPSVPLQSAVERTRREHDAALRRLSRWYRKQRDRITAARNRELATLARETTTARLIEARARQAPADTASPLAFALAHYADTIAALEAVGMPLDLRRLARLAPVTDWARWYGSDEAARRWAEYNGPLPPGTWRDPRVLAPHPDEYARATTTVWKVRPEVTDPAGIPLALLDAWAILCSVRRRHLRRLLALLRRHKTGRYSYRVTIRDWPAPIRFAAKTVKRYLDAANRRRPWHTVKTSMGARHAEPIPFTLHEVLVGVQQRWTLEPTERVSRHSAKERQRERAEEILGGRCRDCGRCRADGVGLQLDELWNDGGGRARKGSGRTYALRRQVIDYARHHGGEAHPDIALRCAACHGRRHRLIALAAKRQREAAWNGREVGAAE